jgi:hypothetical protein
MILLPIIRAKIHVSSASFGLRKQSAEIGRFLATTLRVLLLLALLPNPADCFCRCQRIAATMLEQTLWQSEAGTQSASQAGDREAGGERRTIKTPKASS